MSLFRNFALGAQRVLNATPLLDMSETLACRGQGEPPAPVFILGTPRSGTTLLFELLAAHRRTAYISNLAAMFYRSPALMSRLGLALLGRPKPVYCSTIGYIEGPMSPSEAGALTRHWFTGARPLALREGGRQVRRSVRSICDAFGGPLVYKNLYILPNFSRVLAVFPSLAVVRLRRDPRFVAQSILHVRRSEHGNPETWWGPRPHGWETVSTADPIEQVAWQVTAIERDIDVLAATPELRDRCLTLDYPELCARPTAMLDAISEFYKRCHGEEIAARGESPRRFEAVESVTLSADDWRRLETAVQRHLAAGAA
jgi:hypothetical protein